MEFGDHPPPAAPSAEQGMPTGALVGIVVGVVAALAVVSVGMYVRLRRKGKKRGVKEQEATVAEGEKKVIVTGSAVSV